MNRQARILPRVAAPVAPATFKGPSRAANENAVVVGEESAQSERRAVWPLAALAFGGLAVFVWLAFLLVLTARAILWMLA